MQNFAMLRVAACCSACLALVALSPPARGDEKPLHARIDELVEAAAIGPLPKQADDAEFLRRVSLDLAGSIPAAEEARAFLADTSANKREKLIDRLLASPQHTRRMMLYFDLLFTERRPVKGVKAADWEQYLFDSLASKKPLDQLAREILLGDSDTPALRPAARFYFDRDCEPNVMTRDIGRLFFGMDLQCAQCHDHPIVDDYYQADYYGLQAFVNRTFVFPDAKKATFIAEKGEGEVSYKSVFTGDSADRVTPRVPKGATLIEPTFAKGAEYEVAPAKNVRPIPKFSRRSQLANMATESDDFARNMANRLWALMMGRGLVHSLEMHHIDNPPSNPAVLSLLADEFRAAKFDVTSLLRELALSRTYQRSCETPDRADWTKGSAATKFAQLSSELQSREATLETAKTANQQAQDGVTAALKSNKEYAAEFAKLQASLAKQQQAAEKAQAALAAEKAAQAVRQDQSSIVAEAAAKAQAAVAKLPDDKVLAQAAGKIAERATALAAAVIKGNEQLATVGKLTQAAVEQSAAAEQALTAVAAKMVSPEALLQLEASAQRATAAMHEASYLVAETQHRIDEASLLAKYEPLAESDPAAAEQVWDTLVERWTNRGQISFLKSLSAEQFSLSLMQAVGVVAVQEASAAATIEKTPPPELAKAADSDKPRIAAALVEKKVFENLRGNLNTFVGLYDSLPNEDFQATINQALFFGNGTVVDSWLKPSGNNLAARLAKLSEPDRLADELYLSVFTRFPTAAEREDVAAFLADYVSQGEEGNQDDQRQQAIGEMIWALLSSSEFRFNH
jgi:hypothetical protein